MKFLLHILCTVFVISYVPSVQANFQSIIDEVNSGPSKWKAGHNFESSSLPSDVQLLLGAKKNPGSLPPRQHLLFDSPIPEEFDARKQWPSCTTIGQVPEQGPCRAAWAIAAASAFSDRYCIATNGTFNLPLSAEGVLSCCMACGFGCGGGFQIKAWEYFQKFGIVTGGPYNSSIGCQPYQMHNSSAHLPGFLGIPDPDTPTCQNNCTNPSYNLTYDKDLRKTKSTYSLFLNVTEIQMDIMLHGPVESTFDVYADFATYKSGVYHHVTGEILGIQSVKVFGWGVENGTAYWLASNSWNESWGDKGIFKILRGQNECGFEDQMVAGLPDV